MPSRLVKQVATLEANPQFAALGTYALSIDEFGTPIRLLKRLTQRQGLSFTAMLSSNQILDSTAMMRRTVFDSVGGYRKLKNPGAEDYDLWLRISKCHQV